MGCMDPVSGKSRLHPPYDSSTPAMQLSRDMATKGDPSLLNAIYYDDVGCDGQSYHPTFSGNKASWKLNPPKVKDDNQFWDENWWQKQ